jgi:hypothetical protein
MGSLSGAAASADASELDLPRRPVLTFWLIAVALEVLLGVAFLLTGADADIDRGLSKAGTDFSSDLLTAVRVVVVYPAALLGVTLALAQVAAPDLPCSSSPASEEDAGCSTRSEAGSVRGRKRWDHAGPSQLM